MPCQLLAIILTLGLAPFLTLMGQPTEVIGPISDYATVRFWFLPVAALFLTLTESLKICGLKNLVFVKLLIGFGLNALFNWIFLYTPVLGYFSSLEEAVSYSTILTQLSMTLIGGAAFFHLMKSKRKIVFSFSKLGNIRHYLGYMAKYAPGVGVRHMNDYIGTVAILLMIGTLGTVPLAAAQVATKIMTLFYRIPQACFSAVFAFYGYRSTSLSEQVKGYVYRLFKYSAIPTGLVAVILILSNDIIVEIFSSQDLDKNLAVMLVFAHLLYLPGYFLEHFFGECMTVHQAGRTLFWSSTIATYFLSLPIASACIYYWGSPFWALASKGVATFFLAAVFGTYLYRNFWGGQKVGCWAH